MHDPVADGSCFPKARQYVPRTETVLQSPFIDSRGIANGTCAIEICRNRVVCRQQYRLGTFSQMTLDSLAQSIDVHRTYIRYQTLMTYDLEVISLAAVLDFTSKNLILRSTIGDQVENRQRRTVD
jgi:hypothetical protein